MVNKIPRDFENPIDLILYDQIDNDLEFYKKLGLTPNGLTTISLFLGLLGIYNFYYDNHKIGGLLFFIAYYFDCADGKMARKYNMFSKYGDLYDHVSDLIKLSLLLYIFFLKDFNKFIKVFIIVLLLFTITKFFLNCQEIIYNKVDQSTVLNKLYFSNIKNCDKKMNYLKFFGSGTPILFLTLSMVLWNTI